MPFSSIGRRYDVAYMLDQALGIGRAPNFIEQLQEQIRVLISGMSVNPVATWNNDKLAQKVAAIAMAAQTGSDQRVPEPCRWALRGQSGEPGGRC